MVYPDSIFPKYGAFELLATDDMALEGWVYRKIDEIFSKIGKSSFPTDPIHADRMANLFNEFGYIGIFRALVDHFGLKHLKIEIINSNVISLPGCCKTTTLSQDL